MNKVLNRVMLLVLALTLVVGINAFATFPSSSDSSTNNTSTTNQSSQNNSGTSLLSPGSGTTTTSSSTTGGSSDTTTSTTTNTQIQTDGQKSTESKKDEKTTLPEAGASKLVFVGMGSLAVITALMYKKARK